MSISPISLRRRVHHLDIVLQAVGQHLPAGFPGPAGIMVQGDQAAASQLAQQSSHQEGRDPGTEFHHDLRPPDDDFAGENHGRVGRQRPASAEGQRKGLVLAG
jgi:hypothetical protein